MDTKRIAGGPLAGTTVLVTGGTGGIGKATAMGLSKMGANLAITGRHRNRAEAAAGDIRLVGHGRVDVLVADHPGMVSTSFGAADPSGIQRPFVPAMRPFMIGPDRGAATSIHVASAPDLEQVTGRFFARYKPKRSSKRSYDSAAAARLWNVSDELVRLTVAD